CPNQGNLDENLRQLTQSIARIYCSTLNPNALLYRRSRGLLDYDERMAILIQVVEGEKFQHFFMPHAAGVAFSRNLYRWAPQIRAEDGFVRLVWGLGTRAVDRVGNDYPRLIALSHPLLRPSTDAREVVRYSQQFVDLIDLDENAFRTLPVHEVLDADYPPLRYLAQVDEDGYFVSLRSAILGQEQNKLVLTFDEMLSRTPFAEWMRSTLKVLETTYHAPVDVEFTAQINSDRSGGVNLSLTILQCRPQSQLQQTESESLPSTLSKEDIIFSTEFMVPQGHLDQIHYVVYVDSRGYFSLPTQADRTSLARTIGKLNAAMANEQFICIGPGRWGSANSDLGVPIAYGDIYHTRALVELAGEGYGLPPEPSLGTHFFQDLLESQIYPLAIQLDDSRSQFNNEFFTESPNRLLEWLPDAGSLTGTLKVIRVEDYAPRSHLKVVMNDEIGKAVAFLVRD
ncbi:MAG TPA: phosphoenolpyruvate synthase, partial [Anaerolineaceae bacterium]|nr:phosphoenolpyruvate synthase [Anaerolineaceae bacterium]